MSLKYLFTLQMWMTPEHDGTLVPSRIPRAMAWGGHVASHKGINVVINPTTLRSIKTLISNHRCPVHLPWFIMEFDFDFDLLYGKRSVCRSITPQRNSCLPACAKPSNLRTLVGAVCSSVAWKLLHSAIFLKAASVV